MTCCTNQVDHAKSLIGCTDEWVGAHMNESRDALCVCVCVTHE